MTKKGRSKRIVKHPSIDPVQDMQSCKVSRCIFCSGNFFDPPLKTGICAVGVTGRVLILTLRTIRETLFVEFVRR